MRTEWNTQRPYSAEGQRITARLDVQSREILFTDHTRHIAGCFSCDGYMEFIDSEADLRLAVMRVYDANNYTLLNWPGDA